MHLQFYNFPTKWEDTLTQFVTQRGGTLQIDADKTAKTPEVLCIYIDGIEDFLKLEDIYLSNVFAVLWMGFIPTHSEKEQILAEKRIQLICPLTHSTEDLLDIYLQNVWNIAEKQQFIQKQATAFIESEAKAEAILRSTVSGIITINERGIIESFNLAAEQIFGYCAAEVIGKNISMLMPQPYRKEHNSYLDNYLKTDEARIIGIGREVSGLRKNGEVFPLELAVNDIRLPARRIFSGIIRDISQRRALERALLSISEHERRRIGQELHDGLGQMLTGIGLMTDNLHHVLTKEGNPHAKVVEKITKYIEEADTFARLIARGLVPVQLDSNGLGTALFRLCEQTAQRLGITCTFDAIGAVGSFNHEDAIQLYRIAQEAMNNAVKHGKATQIQVIFSVGEQRARLRVQNNGVPFPDRLPKERGMGLDIMAYRAKLLAASLDIKVAPKGGTILTCTIPLKPKIDV